jgi:hypothetical protein
MKRDDLHRAFSKCLEEDQFVNASVADPDPGSGVFLTPGSQTHNFESLVSIFGKKLYNFWKIAVLRIRIWDPVPF